MYLTLSASVANNTAACKIIDLAHYTENLSDGWRHDAFAGQNTFKCTRLPRSSKLLLTDHALQLSANRPTKLLHTNIMLLRTFDGTR
jgi:hypothetical protein